MLSSFSKESSRTRLLEGSNEQEISPSRLLLNANLIQAVDSYISSMVMGTPGLKTLLLDKETVSEFILISEISCTEFLMFY